LARTRSIIAVLALVAGAALPAAAALADPSTPSTLTYEFTACAGPTGTATQFHAVEQPSGAAALHLTESTGVFIAVHAIDVETGAVLFTTPGFEQNDLTTITCSVVNPANSREQLVTGLMAPPR
jgi:hypothetical protein